MSIIGPVGDTTYRDLHLRGAVGASRTEVFDGRTYTVVPVIALMEGVIFAVNAEAPEYVPLKTLMMAPQGWNGRPVVLDHPSQNGRMISANTPGVLERRAFGVVFNTRVASGKLLMEAWLDPVKAASVGQMATDTVLRAAQGTPVEVSVGVYATIEDATGNFNGKPYKATWVDMIPDHLALLSAGEIGACSNAMGCGVRTNLVTAKGIEITEAVEKEPAPARDLRGRRALRQRVAALLCDQRPVKTLGDNPGHDFHGNQYTDAQKESAAKVTELEGHINRIYRTVSGNTGAAIRKRAALTKYLRSELERHKNIVEPTRPEAVAANAVLTPMKGSRGETSGYDVHHNGQLIGTIKKTTFQDFKTVNGALSMTRSAGFHAYTADGKQVASNTRKRGDAVQLIADAHSRTLRGLARGQAPIRDAIGDGSNQYGYKGSHAEAAGAHRQAMRAHTSAARAKQQNNGNYPTLAAEARVASIAAEHSSLATRDTTAGSLAGRARKTGADGDHTLTANLHERAARYHDSEDTRSRRLYPWLRKSNLSAHRSAIGNGNNQYTKGDRVQVQPTHWNKNHHDKTGTVFSTSTSTEGRPTHWVKLDKGGGEFVHAGDLKPVGMTFGQALHHLTDGHPDTATFNMRNFVDNEDHDGVLAKHTPESIKERWKSHQATRDDPQTRSVSAGASV